MPCTKCEDGKYKWGKTGECKYDTKEACEKANPKKYNKMRPTPIGKKTYEEYAKELKEFNLSTQKFEFADMKTLGTLLSQLDKTIDSLDKQNLKTKESVADFQMTELLDNEAFENLEEQEGNLDLQKDAIEEAKKELVKREKVYEKLDKQRDKTKKAYEKAAQVVFKNKDSYVKQRNKGEATANKMRKAIAEVEKSAKALGVEVPLGTYKQILAKFNATIEDPLDNVTFNY